MQCFSCARIAQIANKISSGTAVLDPYDYVIIHTGTKDIGDRTPYHSIISDYGNLIGIIRQKKRDIIIIMYAIIPRPMDHAISDPMIRKVNQYLQKYMSTNMNFSSKAVVLMWSLLAVVVSDFR